MALSLMMTYDLSSRNYPSFTSSNHPLLATDSMAQSNGSRPSLPSISSLIEAVTEQSEKSRSFVLRIPSSGS